MARMQLTGRGRRWLAGGHPWVYADAIREVEAEPGDLVALEGPDGESLGWGFYSAESKIAVRRVARGGPRPDRAFWSARVRRAIDARKHAGLLDPAGATRLIAGDADGVPGLIVDRYADVLVASSGTQAADRMLPEVLELVEEHLPFPMTCVVDRSDTGVRRLEGLEPRVNVLRGSVPEELIVSEGGLAYEVDVLQGHKTGHYLDQRDNRARAAGLAEGKRVLDAFSYDGLFGIRAALGGARSVVCLDQSAACGERMARNAERNGVADRVSFERANAMGELRAMAAAGRRFDVVIVDPPAFARNRRELAGAERGYVELNRRAFELVEEDGWVVSASCSYNVKPERFVEYLGKAAALARRDVFLEELAGAAPDHPALLTLPESRYLKCAFMRVAARASE
jgi:23S rRNA (cytosine1962-C5)-methyltransferase